MSGATARRFDNNAVRQLYANYRKQIRSYLRKCCDGSRVPVYHVDDLAQEVFVRVARHGLPADVDNVLGYLMRTASHCVANLAQRSRIRREHLRIEDAANLDQFADYDADPEQQLGNEQTSEYIRQVFAEVLTRRQQDVLMLHLGGMTYKDIAELRGLTFRIVLRDITRGYSRLRDALRVAGLVH